MFTAQRLESTKLILAYGALLCWAACLPFPALRVNSQTITSFGILTVGWVGPLLGGYYEWLSNPFIIVAAFMSLSRLPPGVKSALLIIAGFMLLRNITMSDFPENEGADSPIEARYLGWYLWIAAQVAVILALVASLMDRAHEPAEVENP